MKKLSKDINSTGNNYYISIEEMIDMTKNSEKAYINYNTKELFIKFPHGYYKLTII